MHTECGQGRRKVNPSHAWRRTASGSHSTRDVLSKIITAWSALTWLGQPAPGTPVRAKAHHRDWTSGLLHDQVTVSVTRPDWPVWS